MCGIAGILNVHAGAPDLADRAAMMEHALAHRGPDGRGVWVSIHRDAAFAHTRLAIIDPSPAGRQPMSIDAGRLTITFNGEIYNFMEIRRELEARGVAFRSRTDTEVVLRAYDVFGERCVERLRGMFAFAIWDERARRCVLARDRFGIKPLYYSADPERLVFASELGALVCSGLVARTVDASAVYEYFRAGSVPEPCTLLKDARLLEAGHIAIWQGGRLDQRRYFDLSFEPAIADADAPARTREALIDSVQHHFVGDVPVGIFLSGGVDSTALLALATTASHLETRALTMALPGSAEDETALARRTAQHFGVRHDVCEVDEVSAKQLFAEYLGAMDQPSIDGMNTLAISKLAQACGVKVILSGLGADELFGGYPSVRAVPRFAAWNRRLAAGGPLRTAAGQLLERLPDSRWRRLGDMLGQQPSLAASYAMYRGVFTRGEARALTAQFVPDAPRPVRPEAADSDPTPQDAACRLEIVRYLRNQLLRDTDVMSMACGVEVRVPFIDARVVDTVTAIATHDRLRAAKCLLRRSVPEIPEWIAAEPKRGFMFPMERWLGGAWRGTFDDTAARAAVPMGTWYRTWCVHAFESWLDRLRASVVVEPCATLAATRGVNG